MSSIIIGIHGLGNKPPAKVLKKWWKEAIREGLHRIGHPRMFFRFELVYWADFLYPEPLDPKEKNEESPLYIEYPYKPCTNFVRKEPSRLRQRFLDSLEKRMDRLFLPRDKAPKFTALTDLIIHHFFADLEYYYSRTLIDDINNVRPAKEIMREHLKKILRKHAHKNIILVAHSMGSIISYDVLSCRDTGINVNTFVTIGSPLGLPVVISKFLLEQGSTKESTVRTPECILNHWYNLSDLEDRVAMNYNLADDYAENSRHVGPVDRIVFNNYQHKTKRNPHNSYGYLSTPEMAKILYNFINKGKPSWLTRFCDNVNHVLFDLKDKLDRKALVQPEKT